MSLSALPVCQWHVAVCQRHVCQWHVAPRPRVVRKRVQRPAAAVWCLKQQCGRLYIGVGVEQYCGVLFGTYRTPRHPTVLLYTHSVVRCVAWGSGIGVKQNKYIINGRMDS